MKLPAGAVRSPAIGRMLRGQLQNFVLTPAQSVRLLGAWAGLLGPDGGCTYRLTPHDLAALLLSLRPQQLSPEDIQTAVVSLAAFPWPTWDSWRAMQELTTEIVSRCVPTREPCSRADWLLLAWQPFLRRFCHGRVADPVRRSPVPALAWSMQGVRCLPVTA